MILNPEWWMRHFALFSSFVFASAASAQGAQNARKRFEFQGFRLGDSIAIPAMAKGIDCTSQAGMSEVLHERTCFERKQIGDAQTTTMYTLMRERFASWYMSFKTEDWTDIRTAFELMYGPPTASRNEAVQNRMGASFTNTLLTWSFPEGRLTLQKMGSTVTDGNAFISHTTLQAELTAARDSLKRAKLLKSMRGDTLTKSK